MYVVVTKPLKYFIHSLEKIRFEVRKLSYNLSSFEKKIFYSYIYISTMLFNYTRMKMANLSPTPNMSSIGEVCDRHSQTFLTSFVGNHWATGGLRVNSTQDYNVFFVPALGEYNIAYHT